jgi:uncharacterized protein YllA (UPF0747 family)
MEDSSGKNPNTLYDSYIITGKKTNLNGIWGEIPRTLQDLHSLVSNTKNTHPSLDHLIQVLREYHQKFGIYSEKVEENLLKLHNGTILAGQQPIVLGGPGFIANKIAFTRFLVDLLQEKKIDLAPVFMIGDYDGWQKELYRSYLPNPISGNAVIVDIGTELDLNENYNVAKVELPGTTWLDKQVEIIKENFNAFKKQLSADQKKIMDERYNHIITLLKTTYHRSDSFVDFFVILWGTIANIIDNQGIIFIPTTLKEIVPLYRNEYLNFLDKAHLYSQNFKSETKLLIENGYKPSLNPREENYSPFFITCNNCGIRVDPNIKINQTKRVAHGHCVNCKQTFDHNVSIDSDLEKIQYQIGPRVDTSQLILQNLLNIKIRVSGPGEIAYYAQVAPALRKSGFELPIFLKYKRLFYNTVWNESLGKELKEEGMPSLHQHELFAKLKAKMKAKKKEDVDLHIEAEIGMYNFIMNTYNNLLQHKSSQVEKYLSWQFGRFTPEKFGQEVSWLWIDMALQTGINDYLQSYYRQYTKISTPSLSMFGNTSL